MKKEQNENMKHEIEKRMASDLWSRNIASAVIKKKQKRQRTVYGFSSLATAALIVVVTVFTLQNESDQAMQYSDFITLQVQGVHKTSLQKDIIMASGNQSESSGVLFSSAVDDMIDDAILRR